MVPGRYLVATHSNGMSALQLQAKLGIASYKSTWLLLRKLRRAMVDPDRRPLRGIVEMDETNVPYRRQTDPVTGGQGRSPIGKMVLVGAVEIVDKFYAGRMRLQRVQVADREALKRFIAQNAARGTEIITDGYSTYKRPAERKHKAHNLSAKNAMPAHIVLKWIHRIFSNFKRWAMGTYHGLREKHVDIYCNEFVFRWNRRRSFQTSIDTLLGLGQKIGPVTRRGIVGDTRKWKEHAFENGMDIFDALDDIRQDEERHVYFRRKPVRPALPLRRRDEE
ncbi:IS1595 family transposase [Neorhizobium sp. DAR64872/K0K18]|uniref:IS1595 family transposase n=1 Tax=Neorhizobium sp. DAR64872/K0K18 TaxID=3421958 RepID=UPI003D2A5577